MPLPGGPSDKLGNRYETWWTVSELIRLVAGESESIRIEKPGVDVAEFVVRVQGNEVYHQAKRSNTRGSWSLNALGGQGQNLLARIHGLLQGNQSRFIFVSGSDAPELRELIERARDADSVEEFEKDFLSTREWAGKFESLRKEWGSADIEDCHNVLRRVEVRTTSEHELREKVQYGITAYLVGDPRRIADELGGKVLNSVHATISRPDLIHWLEDRGIVLRALPDSATALAHVQRVTDAYLRRAKSELRGRALIPREATTELTEKVDKAQENLDIIITGEAGVGKSSCVLELTESLLKRDLSVLIFRLDRVKPVAASIDLGRQLGFDESPVHVVAGAACGGRSVLIVDQIDAISTTSGRSIDFTSAVSDMLYEVNALRQSRIIHTVLVCREFDWRNDSRLRQLKSDGACEVSVPRLSDDETKRALVDADFSPNSFRPNQLELLRLPQNLSMFLDCDFNPDQVPAFQTTMQLYDQYWKCKRATVSTRVFPKPDQWEPVVKCMSDEITATQQLAVAREKLDRFDAEYVSQMCSEGVISTDGKRYAFNHESFFDYCFARLFVTGKESLLDVLVRSEQHLFRRAQVRQVLTYLRDADRPRYLDEFLSLLEDNRVRAHIKDIALSLIAAVSDPAEDEWAVLEPWIQKHLEAARHEEIVGDKFAQKVWLAYYRSPSWFQFTVKRGEVTRWLASGESNVVDMAVNYAYIHQRHHGDEVADLLAPYADQGGEWPQRLRYVTGRCRLGKSRKIFELILKLIDNGAFDESEARNTAMRRLWSSAKDLNEEHPEWTAELIAHWLWRQYRVASQREQSMYEVFSLASISGHTTGASCIRDAADKAPLAFVERVFPKVIAISDAMIDPAHSEPPIRDKMWRIHMQSDHESPLDACKSSLSLALGKLAKEQPDCLSREMQLLKDRKTYTSNLLLLEIYTSAIDRFADEAADLLCNEPWRLECGYSGSHYWVARTLIAKAMRSATDERRAKLERAALQYRPEWERSCEGTKCSGNACFELLTDVPFEFLTPMGRRRMQELSRKPRIYASGPPTSARACWVGPPIDPTAARKMKDDHWLGAIAEYKDDERPDRLSKPNKGGASHLAGVLSSLVCEQPDRFARLALTFPAGTNSSYLRAVLNGLKDSKSDNGLVLQVCRLAFNRHVYDCGGALADLIGSLQSQLPDDIVKIVSWLATKHPDPQKGSWKRRSDSGNRDIHTELLTHGINTTRGRAVEAIRDLIQHDPSCAQRFSAALEDVVQDEDLGVRSCAASTLIVLAISDRASAIRLFLKLVDESDCLLATHYVERFLYRALPGSFHDVRPVIKRMLKSPEPNVREAGARLFSLARLHGHECEDIPQDDLGSDESLGFGVAQVAAKNIGLGDCRDWCEARLIEFFDDPSGRVRLEAASCFSEISSVQLEDYEGLIKAFCKSNAYEDDASSLLQALESSTCALPEITYHVCESFLQRFGSEASGLSTHIAGDASPISELVFRLYHQHQKDTLASPCLNLIDRMCIEGIHTVYDALEAYER